MPSLLQTIFQGGNSFTNQAQPVLDPGIISLGGGNSGTPIFTGGQTGVLQPVTGSGTTTPVNTGNPPNTTGTGSNTTTGNTTGGTTTTNTGGTGTTTTNTTGTPEPAAISKPIYHQWWFWVIVAAVVIGGGYFIIKSVK